MEKFREFLKCKLMKDLSRVETDRKKGLPAPPCQKPCPENATMLELIAPEELSIGKMPLIEAISGRKSRRKYADKELTFEEISFLLWATQGVRKISQLRGKTSTYRTVPSGGNIHPFETYLLANRVEGVEPGLYRYLPLKHSIYFISGDKTLNKKVHEACFTPNVLNSAVTLVWTVIPYRGEWMYGASCHKIMAIDAGHVCQNLYLACEAINVGVCAIGGYDQKEMDHIINVDGKDEFTIYAASVGKVNTD